MDESVQPRMQRPVTRWQLLVAIVATAVLTSVTTVWAGKLPTFNDVPPSNFYYDYVEWMASTDITTGFADGGYHPKAPVLREQMAAFMQRLFNVQDDLAVAAGDNSSSTSSPTFIPLATAEATVEIPAGAQGYILATFTAESVCSGASGYCRVRLMIDANGDDTFTEMLPAEGADYAFDSTDAGSETSSSWESRSIQRYATVGRGCTCTVRVERSVSSVAVVFDTDDWLLTVQTDLLPSDESFGP